MEGLPHNLGFIALLLVIVFRIQGVSGINLRQGPLPALVRPGATATLTCDVDQKGGTTVYWYHLESQEYISHDRIIYTRIAPAERRRRYSIVGDRSQDVFTLRIADVVLADDGTYQCGYANDIGRFNVLASARLTVLIPPTDQSPMCYINVVSGDPKVRKVGDVVDMVCTTEGGNPVPDLTWFRGEEEVEENEGLRSAVHRQILRPQDANLNYTCLMRGPMVTTRRTCSLRPMEVPPEVKIEPTVNSVTVGSTATFTCSMMGGDKIGVKSYVWEWDPPTASRLQSPPGRVKHSDRVLEIQDIQKEDDNTMVTCKAHTNTGELLTGHAKLVIKIEPTVMATTGQDMTTGEEGVTDGSNWQRAMRPDEGTEIPVVGDFESYETTEDAVTVGMKPKIPAFLTGRTFIMTSAALGAFLIILIIVIVVIVKVVRRRSGKKMPITSPVMMMEHGNSEGYATILEMKRKSGSTYKGSATLPALKSERKIGLPDVMRGGSSLSLTARSAGTKGSITERSPLYAKPDKLRTSKHRLFGDSRKDDVECPDDNEINELIKEDNLEKDKSAASTLSKKDLNAEGLIYADLVLDDKDKPKRISTKKGTQYASIVPSGKP